MRMSQSLVQDCSVAAIVVVSIEPNRIFDWMLLKPCDRRTYAVAGAGHTVVESKSGSDGDLSFGLALPIFSAFLETF